MVKIGRHVTIELEIYEAAKRAGINISEACEMGLADALHIDAQKTPEQKREDRYSVRMKLLLKVITDEHREKCAQKVGESQTWAVGWAKVFKRNYGIIVLPTEIIEVFGKKK